MTKGLNGYAKLTFTALVGLLIGGYSMVWALGGWQTKVDKEILANATMLAKHEILSERQDSKQDAAIEANDICINKLEKNFIKEGTLIKTNQTAVMKTQEKLVEGQEEIMRRLPK